MDDPNLIWCGVMKNVDYKFGSGMIVPGGLTDGLGCRYNEKTLYECMKFSKN